MTTVGIQYTGEQVQPEITPINAQTISNEVERTKARIEALKTELGNEIAWLKALERM